MYMCVCANVGVAVGVYVRLRALTFVHVCVCKCRSGSGVYVKLRALSFLCVLAIFLYSAGVGRTGSYIAVDTLLEQANNQGVVDIYNFTLAMRHSRINMIQTLVSRNVDNSFLYINSIL